MLSARPHVSGVDAHGLACAFNLKPATAAKLIELEQLRRRDHG